MVAAQEIISQIEEGEEEKKPVYRSSDLERAKFMTRAIMPKLLSPLLQRMPFIDERSRDMLTMRKCLLDNSTTYALALQAVVDDTPELGYDLVIAHQGFKLLDFGEENKEFLRNERKEFMNHCLDTLSNPSSQKIKDLEQRVEPLMQHPQFDSEFTSLLRNMRPFIRAFHTRPLEVREIFLKYANRMAAGFANPEVQKINDLTDVHRYCLIAAGFVGWCITENLAIRGYVSRDMEAQLMPHAITMGKAVQLGNNLRDFFKDYESGMWRWPKLNMEAIARARTPEDITHVYENEFREIVNYTKKHFHEATSYFDQLPSAAPYGPKVFTGLGLAAYAAVVGRVSTREFLETRGHYKKLRKHDALDIKDAVQHYACHGESIEPLIGHLLNNKPIAALFE